MSNGFLESDSASCNNGIVVGGDSNQLTSIDVFDAAGQGIQVDGDSNRLTSVLSTFSGKDGLIVFGDTNTIRRSNFSAGESDLHELKGLLGARRLFAYLEG